MGQSESTPQPIVHLEKDEPVYDYRKFVELMKSAPGDEDTKMYVIGISGKYRSGKSFLLNLLKVYLDYYSEHGTDSGWNHAESLPIKGWKWSRGKKSVTHGIWMYMYPKLIGGKAILLMDCQGTADLVHSNPTLDNLILFLALQLSDVHILNVTQTFGTDALSHLNVCALHADDDETGSIFQRNVVLVRDWNNDEPPMTIDELCEETKSASVKADIKGIKKAFRAFDIEGFPYPGSKVSRGSEEGEHTLGDLDEWFLDKALAFFHKLLFSMSTDAELNRNMFSVKFKFISSRAVGQITAPDKVYTESVIKAICEKEKKEFQTRIDELKREQEAKSMALTVLEQRAREIFGTALKKYTCNPKVEHCEYADIVQTYQSLMEDHFKMTVTTMKYQHAVQETTRRLREEELKAERSKRQLEEKKKAAERAAKAEAELQQKLNEMKKHDDKKKQQLHDQIEKARKDAEAAKALQEKALLAQEKAEREKNRARDEQKVAERRNKEYEEKKKKSWCTIL